MKLIDPIRYDHFLKSLIKNNIVEKYPPLYDIKGSYVAQFEHTIYIGENNKIIFDRKVWAVDT